MNNKSSTLKRPSSILSMHIHRAQETVNQTPTPCLVHTSAPNHDRFLITPPPSPTPMRFSMSCFRSSSSQSPLASPPLLPRIHRLPSTALPYQLALPGTPLSAAVAPDILHVRLLAGSH